MRIPSTQGKRILETCFEQSPKMEYVVSGLSPGQSYMLRVVLFERSNALAVSVRSFRVGAVSIYSDDLDVTTSNAITILSWLLFIFSLI